MNTEEALQFLKLNQPMPGDLVIGQAQCDSFIEAMDHFINKPDVRCIPLFVNSVSQNTGMGMYEKISDVLMAHRREDVIPSIKNGLASQNNGVKYRCSWWAIDLDAWELESSIEPLLTSSVEDVRDVAASFMDLKSENV